MLPTFSYAPLGKSKKNRREGMCGSPKHKKQHKISPTHNAGLTKYKKSREAAKAKSRSKDK
jgi:hypothetical protein